MAGAITRRKVTRADLAQWDGRNATVSSVDATGGTVTGLTVGNEVDILQVFGSGTDRTSGTLSTALAYFGSTAVTIVFAPGTWTISDNITIPATVVCHVPAGAVFSVDSGKTLTISGSALVEYPASWTTGSGTVTASGGTFLGGLKSAAEISAGVTPTYYAYPELDARRYGCAASASAATNVTAINNASLVAYTAGGGFVELPYGTLSVNGNLLMRNGVKFRGQGTVATVLSYTGAAKVFISNTTGTRTYDQGIRDLSITDAGTGTMAIDLDSISTSHFENVNITGFDTAVRVYSPTSGYAVYNRFTNVLANSCTKGFSLAGVGSNATRFDRCRFNGATQVGTTAFELIDANGCSVVDCDLDVVENAFVLTAPTGAGYTDSNIFRGNRIEACTTVYNLGANVRYTHILDNAYINITTLITDSGTRNSISDPPYRLHAEYADTSIANGQVRLHRSVTGGSSLPFMVVRDSVNSDTPITLQIETERSVGSFLRAQRGASTYLEAYATGALGIRDGISAPSAVSGQAILFVDSSDGDLKVIFGDGTTKTIVVDT